MGYFRAIRLLLRQRMFTAVTVLTLAIGTGANSAIFAVIEGVLLKPLSYPQPEQLLDVNHAAPGAGLEKAGSAPFLYLTYRIACANVANLMPVRAQRRQHELAIRAAIGAGGWRIARELLVESVTLGILGGLAGLGLARGAPGLLAAIAPANLPRLSEIALWDRTPFLGPNPSRDLPNQASLENA